MSVAQEIQQGGVDLVGVAPGDRVRAALDQHHGLARAMVLVVDLDVGRVLPADGDRAQPRLVRKSNVC